MIPVQQVPWKSIYLAGGLLIAGAFTWRSPACLCGPWWDAEAPVGLTDAPCPPCYQRNLAAAAAARDCSAATAAQAVPLLLLPTTPPLQG